MAVTVLQEATAPAPGVARALGDALRWRIIELLATEQLCVRHLAEELGAAQPLVSHHVKTLREAGLVDAERYRYWTYYRLRPEALRGLAGHLDTLAGAGLVRPRALPLLALLPAAPRTPARPRRPPRPPGRRRSDRDGLPAGRRRHVRAPAVPSPPPRRQPDAVPRRAHGPAHPAHLRPLDRAAKRGVPRRLLVGDRGALRQRVDAPAVGRQGGGLNSPVRRPVRPGAARAPPPAQGA